MISTKLQKTLGQVFFDGAVGADDGKLLLDVLAQHHIDATWMKKREDMPSGHTVIQVDRGGQNNIILFGGANQSHSKEEIDACLQGFGPGDYVVLQNETNYVGYMMEQAAQRGLKVCFNVSPLDDKIKEYPLELCSFLIVNEIEGAALVGANPDDDPYAMIKQLRDKFTHSSILLTLGSRGSILALTKEAAHGGQALLSCKAYKMQAVDTTAAGDTFLGFFVEQLSEGVAPAEALQRATAASAIAVTRPGAAPSIPTIAEVKAFLQEHEGTLVDKL